MRDVDGGRMDGFIRVTDRQLIRECRRNLQARRAPTSATRTS